MMSKNPRKTKRFQPPSGQVPPPKIPPAAAVLPNNTPANTGGVQSKGPPPVKVESEPPSDECNVSQVAHGNIPPQPPPFVLTPDQYLAERKGLNEGELKQAEQHDKAILALSAGGLGITLTFIKELAPNPHQDTIWIIASSWAGFVVSLCSILLSFITSQTAFRRQRTILDVLFHERRLEKSNCWLTRTAILNYVAYFFFIVGAAFAAVFSWANMFEVKK